MAVHGLVNARWTGDTRPWLMRSAAPDALDDAGVTTLRRLGVTVVVDLREPGEAGVGTSAPLGIPVVPVPLYGGPLPRTGRLEDIYEKLLRHRGTALATAVGVIADAEGAALVHCTAGKDRTGLVVALARLLAGTDPADVLDDYALSGDQVRPVRLAQAEALAGTLPPGERAEVLRLHLESPPEALRHALTVLDGLGGVETYLTDHGLTPEQAGSLRHKVGR